MAQLVVKILSDLSQFHTDLQNNTKQLRNFGKGLTDIGQTMSLGISAPIIGIGIASATMSTELNKGMANVATLIPNATERVLELKSGVQALAIEVGTGTKDISGGLYEVISTFGDTADTLDILRINAIAAKAGLATTEEALGLTAAVTKGYGDTTKEAVQHAADLGFMAVNLGQTTFPELAASIGHVVPIAQALGVTQEELFAQMATLTGVTGSTAEVTTQLRATFQAILKPSEEMQGAMAKVAYELDQQGQLAGGPLVDNWKRLGEQHSAAVEQFHAMTARLNEMTAAGQTNTAEFKLLTKQTAEVKSTLKPMADAVDEAAGALGQNIIQSVGAADAIRLLNDTFGGNSLAAGKAWSSVEALTAVLALSGSQAESYTEKYAAMTDVVGTTDQAFQDQTQTVNKNGFEMEVLQAKVEVMMQKLGDGLGPAISIVLDKLSPMVDLLIGAADGFSKMDPVQQTVIVGIFALVAAIGPLLVIAGTLITSFTTVTAAMGAITAAGPLMGAAMTLMLGPVGLIILAVAGLVAGLVILWNTNEDFRNAVTGIWEFISAAFIGALDFIKLAFEDFPEFQRRAWEMAIGLTKAYINTYIKLVNWFLDQINNLHIDVPKVELPGGGSVGGFAIDLPDIPKIPELAAGGIALRSTLARIGEDGPEAVVPLNSATLAGLGGDRPIQIIVNHPSGDIEFRRSVVSALREARSEGARI